MAARCRGARRPEQCLVKCRPAVGAATSRALRVDRLVALAIGAVIARDVRAAAECGQRDRSPRRSAAVISPQPDGPAAMEVPGQNLSVKPYSLALEHDARAGLELLSRMDKGVPDTQLRSGRIGNSRVGAAEQQTFDRAPARRAAAKQSRRKDARVVEDEEIAGAHMVREREVVCSRGPRRRGVSAGASGRAFGGAVRPAPRELEIEISDARHFRPKKGSRWCVPSSPASASRDRLSSRCARARCRT